MNGCAVAQMEPERARWRSPALVIQEQQELDVDAEPFGALLLDEARDLVARRRGGRRMSSFSSPPPSPILRTPSARTSVKLSDEHAGRRIIFAEPLNSLGGEASLFLELLDRGALDRCVRILIADKSGGSSMQRQPVGTRGWSTRITLPSCSARITTALMPRVRLAYSHLPRLTARTYLPAHITSRRGKIVQIHSSINLSGISFVSSPNAGNARKAPLRRFRRQPQCRRRLFPAGPQSRAQSSPRPKYGRP